MSRYLSATLTAEASGWISEQLLEEGALVPAALVESILDHEWRALQAGTDPDDRAALIAAVSASLGAEDVRIQAPPAPGVEAMPAAPQAVPESLIDRVLGWEDDFLGLAGVRRSAPDA